MAGGSVWSGVSDGSDEENAFGGFCEVWHCCLRIVGRLVLFDVGHSKCGLKIRLVSRD